MAEAQQNDPEIKALKEALITQQPLHLSATIKSLYHMVFIAPASQIIWIRHSNIDKILVPKSLQLPLTKLMHSSLQYSAHCGVAPTIRIIQILFI